jgi:teichuronic acid biosynthesis glycosyltransferase TuaC
VVAVDVGAVDEMLTHTDVGRIVAGRDPLALAQAVRQLIDSPPAREALRRHAAGFEWRSISLAQHALFQRCVDDWQAATAPERIGAERPAA